MEVYLLTALDLPHLEDDQRLVAGTKLETADDGDVFATIYSQATSGLVLRLDISDGRDGCSSILYPGVGVLD